MTELEQLRAENAKLKAENAELEAEVILLKQPSQNDIITGASTGSSAPSSASEKNPDPIKAPVSAGSSEPSELLVAEEEWLKYIEGLTDDWEILLEETSWKVFQWQKEELAKPRKKFSDWLGLSGPAHSLWDHINKKGLMDPNTSCSPINKHPDRVRETMFKAWGNKSFYQNVLKVIKGVRQKKPKSKYNPEIMLWGLKRQQVKFTLNGDMLFWGFVYPYANLFYNRLEIKFYEHIDWKDQSKDNNQKRREAFIHQKRYLDGELEGSIDLKEIGISPKQGRFAQAVFGTKDGRYGSGGKQFFLWGAMDDKTIVPASKHYIENESELEPSKYLIDKAGEYLKVNVQQGKTGKNWMQILSAFGVPQYMSYPAMTSEEAYAKVKNWSGWKEFADELKRLGL